MLKSKRFWSTFIGIGAVIATKWFGVDDTTVRHISDMVMVLVAAFGAENVVKAAKG